MRAPTGKDVMATRSYDDRVRGVGLGPHACREGRRGLDLQLFWELCLFMGVGVSVGSIFFDNTSVAIFGTTISPPRSSAPWMVAPDCCWRPDMDSLLSILGVGHDTDHLGFSGSGDRHERSSLGRDARRRRLPHLDDGDRRVCALAKRVVGGVGADATAG